ncbi:MAG: VWA domain-containing protein [Myxococcota bacterium]
MRSYRRVWVLLAVGATACDDDVLFRIPEPPPAPEPSAPLPEPPFCEEQLRALPLASGVRAVDFVFYIDRSGSMNDPAGSRTRYSLALGELERFLGSLEPESRVAIQTFPPTGNLFQSVSSNVPTDAVGVCAACRDPSCAFEPCATDADCASGTCRGSVCLCGGNRSCNASFTCAENFCDGGPPPEVIVQAFESGSLDGLAQACTGQPECRTLRGSNRATCRSFDAVLRNPQPGLGGSACLSESYGNMSLELSNDLDKISRAFGILASRNPSGETPLGPALAGSRSYVEQAQQLTPERRLVQILITDGDPTDCNGFGTTAILDILGQMSGAPSRIPSFTIGIFADADGKAFADELAEAGGTSTAITVDPSTGSLGDELGQALNSIRESVVACQTPYPNLMGADPDRVELELVGTSSASRDRLNHVRDAAACSSTGEWYYEDSTSTGQPVWIHLCPAACERVQGEAPEQLELVEACSTSRDDY